MGDSAGLTTAAVAEEALQDLVVVAHPELVLPVVALFQSLQVLGNLPPAAEKVV